MQTLEENGGSNYHSDLYLNLKHILVLKFLFTKTFGSKCIFRVELSCCGQMSVYIMHYDDNCRYNNISFIQMIWQIPTNYVQLYFLIFMTMFQKRDTFDYLSIGQTTYTDYTKWSQRKNQLIVLLISLTNKINKINHIYLYWHPQLARLIIKSRIYFAT